MVHKILQKTWWCSGKWPLFYWKDLGSSPIWLILMNFPLFFVKTGSIAPVRFTYGSPVLTGFPVQKPVYSQAGFKGGPNRLGVRFPVQPVQLAGSVRF